MRVPSTQALRALEAFSRHGTVWQVAEELNLTRSAVSHQLRGLERDLGFKIMEKNGTSVEITPRGRAYAKDVRKALNILVESMTLNASRGLSGKIRISCPAGLSASWLSPHMGTFVEAHPDIIPELVTPRKLDDYSTPDVDIFIVFGKEPKVKSKLLRRVEFAPLCSPSYLNKFDGFTDRRSLSQATLIHIADYQDWEEWLVGASLPVSSAHRGIIFSDMNLAYTAALASQGILVGDEFVCFDAMRRGLLVRPFEFVVQSEAAYYLVPSARSHENPLIDAFLLWMEGVLSTN